MLPFLASFLTKLWGPFRLLGSTMVLIGLGSFAGALICWYLLPRLWHRLPTDRGKALVADGSVSKGKPTGAGVIVVSLALLMMLLVIPWSWRFLGIITCLFLIMLTGYLDDASRNPWSEVKKGFLDIIISLTTAGIFCEWEPVRVWIPFIKGELFMSPWLYIPLAGFLLFVCVNAVNCSDGVDGLAGSLSILTLLELGGFLYLVIGHNEFADYFNVPHYGSGARWATMMFTAAGFFAGYLWYNAYPSAVLMGDAGSRFLGLLIGIGALATGNMFSFLIVAPILIINGGSGLVKLTILRILKKMGCDTRMPLRNVSNPQNPKNFADEQAEKKQLWLVRLLHRVRFPLHDHCKKQLEWSNPQVMVRFMLLQLFITPLLFLLLIKLR
ncbi:MAG: hypothetical protein J6X55_10795 [Victivallales bacterium]|nr:hypothetical protein [Victivallales bacterium]